MSKFLSSSGSPLCLPYPRFFRLAAGSLLSSSFPDLACLFNPRSRLLVSPPRLVFGFRLLDSSLYPSKLPISRSTLASTLCLSRSPPTFDCHSHLPLSHPTFASHSCLSLLLLPLASHFCLHNPPPSSLSLSLSPPPLASHSRLQLSLPTLDFSFSLPLSHPFLSSYFCLQLSLPDLAS